MANSILDRIFGPTVASFTGANTFNINLNIPVEAMQTLSEINNQQKQIFQELTTMNEAMQRITREVEETRSQNASIIALVNGLSEQIRANAADPVALNALADSLDAGQAEIAAAVAANTPAPPPTA